MVSISERVAFLEGQDGEQVAATRELRMDLGEMRRDFADVKRDLVEVKGELAEVKRDVADLKREMDHRFELVDQRFDRMEDRFERRFTWLAGMQIATLLAVVGALAAPYFR